MQTSSGGIVFFYFVFVQLLWHSNHTPVECVHAKQKHSRFVSVKQWYIGLIV